MKPNSLTRDINKGIRQFPRPSLRTIGKWREEWKETGADFKYSFESYKRHKINLWYAERRKKKKEKELKQIHVR